MIATKIDEKFKNNLDYINTINFYKCIIINIKNHKYKSIYKVCMCIYIYLFIYLFIIHIIIYYLSKS